MVKLKKKLPEDIENYFNIDINLLNLDYFLKNYEVSEKILLKIRKYLFDHINPDWLQSDLISKIYDKILSTRVAGFTYQ